MLSLPPTVTMAEAIATQRLLAEASGRESGGDVVVDASHLQRFDSAALAVLLGVQRLVVAAGKSFHVVGMPVKLTSLATLYGIDNLLMPAAAPAVPMDADLSKSAALR